MNNEIATRSHGGLTITADQEWWSDRQAAALAQIGVADAPKADQAVFLHYCQRTGLDPFARQIYMIGRWSREGTKYTIQTSIDGFRLIGRRAADAHHEQLEVSDTEWCGPDGQWRDVWLSDEPPAAARVSVIRNGGRFPAVALFREYAQAKKDGNLTQMWQDKGALMIAKCAEALAWRKAFPQDLSGLYTGDEMSQADTHRAPIPAASPMSVQTPTSPASAQAPVDITASLDGEVMVTAEQTELLKALMADLNLDAKAMLKAACDITGCKVASAKDLTEIEADLVIAELNAKETPA